MARDLRAPRTMKNSRFSIPASALLLCTLGSQVHAEPVADQESTGAAPVDYLAQARDVNLARIVFAADAPVPAYDYPGTDGFSLGGTEFWQRWPGGHNPTFSYEEGTEHGRRCMYASARRFEAIMADPPAALVQLRDESSWDGSFFNWNDDYTRSPGRSESGAILWAWRTGLIKWISRTHADGSCDLPTRALVERAAQSCLQQARRDGGEIEGCSARQ
jgi:hypothetical protein